MSKDLEFEQAMNEFLSNGGEVQELDYNGPKFVEKTARAPGYIASIRTKEEANE